MTYTYIQLIIGIMIGGISAALLSFVTVWKYIKQSRTALVSSYNVEVQALLDSCVSFGVCDRAQVLRTHNGGGKIYAGKTTYVTCLFEATNKETRGLKSKINNYEAGFEYSNLIRQIEQEKKVLLKTENPSYSDFHNLQFADDITAALFVFLAETENGMYFAKFETKGDSNTWLGDKESYPELNLIVSKMKNSHIRCAKYNALH